MSLKTNLKAQEQVSEAPNDFVESKSPKKPVYKAENKTYRYWRVRIMYSMMIGYAAYYFVRLNFSMAAPYIAKDLSLSNTDLGICFSVFSVIYGVGKFLNGFLSDRFNARYFMALGLFASAIVNVFMGFGEALTTFIIFYGLNAWFQSMGWPPCARLLTHWYSPKELGTRWGFWNSSHQIGGALIVLLSGVIIANYGWQAAFYIPAAIVAVVSIFLVNRLRDTPQSLGLPPVEKYKGLIDDDVIEGEEKERLTMKEIFFDHILPNKHLWYICFATFFLYIVRMGFMNWAPKFLVEVKGSSANFAGGQFAGFEIAGILGGFFAGWCSDKIFHGKRGQVATLYMIVLTLFLVYFWWIPAGYEWLDMSAMIAVGFLIYGPQVLTGLSAADFSSKKVAGAATGLTATFGYVGSAIFSGVGLGKIADIWGWNGGFVFFIACSLAGTLFFALTWNQRSKFLNENNK